MLQHFKPYLNTDYTYTPYVHELGDRLNTNEVLVIGNLLNKLNSFNADLTIHYKNDTQRYHYYYNQKEIYTKELRSFPRSTFERTLASLSDKKLIEYSADKNPNGKGYDTTYYYIHTEAISKLMVKNESVPNLRKNKVKNVFKSKNETKQEKVGFKVNPLIQELNNIQQMYDKNEIDRMEYNTLFQPLKKQIQIANNNRIIKRNNITKVWEIV